MPGSPNTEIIFEAGVPKRLSLESFNPFDKRKETVPDDDVS